MATLETLAMRVSEEHEISFASAKRYVHTMFEAIERELTAGDRVVKLHGFGNFELRYRKARLARRKDGTTVQVPERKTPYFSPSRTLKRLVGDSIGKGNGAGPPTDAVVEGGSEAQQTPHET